MTRRPAAFFAMALMILAASVSIQTLHAQTATTPHEAPIKYVDRPPTEGTPQAAMLKLVLFRETGRTTEAAQFISKECPDWLREGTLKSDGPLKKETLSYQLREYTPDKALVSVDYNTADGTFKGWTRSVVREDGKWVVR